VYTQKANGKTFGVIVQAYLLHILTIYLWNQFHQPVFVGTHNSSKFNLSPIIFQKKPQFINSKDKNTSNLALQSLKLVLTGLDMFQFSIAFYKCGDAAKFEELTRALVPVIVRDVKEDEEASVVCGCLEALVRLPLTSSTSVIKKQSFTNIVAE
jgi:hypothetical protein